MRAQSLSHVWLCNTMDCSLPGFSVHGIFQTRRLEWVAISFSRGSSRPRDRTCVFCIGRQILTQESNQKCLVSSRKTQAELWEVASIESEWLRWGTKKKKAVSLSHNQGPDDKKSASTEVSMERWTPSLTPQPPSQIPQHNIRNNPRIMSYT